MGRQFIKIAAMRAPLLVALGAFAAAADNAPNCALLFFGLPKHFKDIVLPSIRSEILAHNPGCDVFAHTYNVTNITTARNGEDGAAIHPDEVFALTRNVVVDAPHALPHDLEHYHPYVAFDWKTQQMDNMIKQWHSIERAWGAMVDGERRRGRRYARVGLFRLDVKYVTPVRVGDGAVAAVPNFGHWNGPRKGLNDRAFYGGRAYAELWATARFPQADAYLASHKTRLHSEIFMTWLLRDVPVELKPFCFLRVRATGEVKQRDCERGGGHTDYKPPSRTKASTSPSTLRAPNVTTLPPTAEPRSDRPRRRRVSSSEERRGTWASSSSNAPLPA
jgi:hypothetical protein